MFKYVKRILIITMIFTLFTAGVVYAAPTRTIEIKVDGQLIESDPGMGKPFIENGRTQVPIRLVSENLGLEVEWDNPNRKAIIGNGKIVLKIGSNIAEVNGMKVKVDEDEKVAPKIVGDRTYVPVRFISEKMNYRVEYNQTDDKHIINIYTTGGISDKGLRVPGESDEDILARIGQKKRQGIDLGNVSDKWIDPQIMVAYHNPFNNPSQRVSPYGFVISNARAFKGKDPDKYYLKIEIIDEKFVPWNERFEIKQSDGTWKPFDGPFDTGIYPLNPDERGGLVGIFDYSPFDAAVNDFLRVKGTNEMRAPYLGDTIRYRLTVVQDGEEHIYEFDVDYGWMITEGYLAKHVKDGFEDETREKFKHLGFYQPDGTKPGIYYLPFNWDVIK